MSPFNTAAFAASPPLLLSRARRHAAVTSRPRRATGAGAARLPARMAAEESKAGDDAGPASARMAAEESKAGGDAGPDSARMAAEESKAGGDAGPDSARMAAEESKKGGDAGPDYWPGEIVCADCGYIYNNAKKKRKFEDLPDTWVCPQCNASKRRFARKVGDFVEKTAGTDNTPIFVFSAVGLVATLGFFVWASQNL